MNEPTTTPQARPTQGQDEPVSDLMFLIGVLSLLLGALTLFAAFLFWMVLPPGDEAARSHLRLILAVGAGLFVLGAALKFDGVIDFFRQRKSVHAVNAALSSVLVVALVVFVNMLASKHDFWRADLTAEGLYTITEETRTLIAKLPTDVRLVAVMPERTGEKAEAVNQILEQLAGVSSPRKVLLDRVNPDMRDPQKLQLALTDLGLDPASNLDDLVGVVVQTGQQTAAGWVKDRSKHVLLKDLWTQEASEAGPGRSTFLGEQKLASAIQELVEGERPKLYFLDGHGEAQLEGFDDETGLGQLATLLRSRNVQVESLKLGLGAAGRIPADCALLVVGGPKAPLTEPERLALREYLERGGDAVLCLDPTIQPAGRRTRFVHTGLEELASELYGVEVDDSMVFGLVAVPGGYEARSTLPVRDLDPSHPITAPLFKRRIVQIAIDDARPISLAPKAGVVQATLAKIDHRGEELFATSNPLLLTKEGKTDQSDMKQGPFTFFVACERATVTAAGAEAPKTEAAKRSRVIVVGDVDWLTNGFIGASYTQNLEVFLNGMAWAMEREQKIVGEAKRPRSYKLEVPEGMKGFLQLATFFGFPAIAVTLGVFAWMIRRR